MRTRSESQIVMIIQTSLRSKKTKAKQLMY